MTRRRRPAPSPKPLERGQIWQIRDLNLRVETVGKLLVHYKFGKSEAKRIPTSVSSKKDLENYLTENKAILVQE